MASEGMNALGAIETFGLVWVLEAGDAMCKAGDVELIGYENTASGYISILVQGDVAACKAAVEAGAPAGIVGWIEKPSLVATNTLMSEADIILATGGPGMVNAAYSSGTPALGVGPGNNPAIIDDSADVVNSVNSIMQSKTFDNGMICATEQNVIVLDGVYDAVKAEFQKRGAFFLQGDDIDKVGNTVIVNGAVNAKMVGQPATKIAETAGVEVPAWTKVLIGETESVEPSNPWAHEKLTTILGMYRASDFDDALAKASRLVADGGYGHTSSLFIDTRETEKLQKHAHAMKTCRILINTPAAQGGIDGPLFRRAHGAGEEPHRHPRRSEQRRQGSGMLLRQDFRGSHHGALPSRAEGQPRTGGGHRRFTGAHISLHQP